MIYTVLSDKNNDCIECLSFAKRYKFVIKLLLNFVKNNVINFNINLYMDPLKLARDFDNFFIT